MQVNENTAVLAEETQELDSQEILNKLRTIRVINIWASRIFFVVLFAVAVISFIIPLRPTYSENEKRELEKFPKFSLTALFSGDYFEGIDTWYSDTFPAREFFTDLNTRFTGLFGKTDVQIHGDVEQGDVIPSVDTTVSEEASSEEVTESKPESHVSSAPSSSQAVSSAKPPQPPLTQTLGALLINGDSAYEYYNFSKSVADSYAAAVSRAGVLLAGKANVYDIIVPTSMGITAPEKLTSQVSTSDQKAAIEYMYSKMQSPVKCVPIYEVLKSKRKEYIYFRTDHHWTALGAYYAYCELMKARGAIPTTLDMYSTMQFPGFLGSFYTSSNKLPQLAANPDTVVAYVPPDTNVFNIQGKNGAWFEQKIISDMSTSTASNKYISFIRGDNPFSIITNPNLHDGTACVVIKESFGNAFVPFLVYHYQKVYIVDYRYFSTVDGRGLVQLCTEAGAEDVIFINNISATRNKSLVNSIDAFVR